MSDGDTRDPGVPGSSETAAQAQDRRIRAIRGSGGRPLGAGDPPKFSQPVRQIVMMLIVLALVAAGGWFAYGRILSIFAANRPLNGLILFVFALGVLTCFWQVAQLVNSVSWIERFAARRRNALESGVPVESAEAPQNAPRLLAPLAALLGGSGALGGIISTASSRSILESVAARIDEARDITRYLSNLLIFLGLLGTFYGLATTVPAVVETIRALNPQDGETGLEIFDKLMSGLEGQLGGMATAFSSSLLGLAGSLVVGLLELFASHGQNRFYRELEEWMSGFTRLGLSGADGEGVDQAVIAGFLDHISGQMADLHEFYLNRDASREEQAAAADARLYGVTRSVEALAEKILGQGQQLGEQAEITGQAMVRMAEGHDRLADLLSEGRDLQLTEAREGRSVLARLAEGQAQLTQQIASTSQLATSEAQGRHAALIRVADGQDRLTAHFMTRDDTGRLNGDVMAQALARLVEGQERLIALASRPVEVTAAAPAPVAAPAEVDEAALREAQMRLRSIDNQLAKMAEEMAATRADMIADLRGDMSALTRAIRRLGQGDEA